MQKHIVKSFDQDISHLRGQVKIMTEACISQIDQASVALKRSDLEKASQVVEKDDQINGYQQTIEGHCVKIITLRQPMAEDLRYLLGAIKIASELERIGDYAANISKRVSPLSGSRDQEIINRIVRMAENCSKMLGSAFKAFLQLDAVKAGDVWHQDDEIDSDFAQLVTLVHLQVQKEKIEVETGTQMIFMGRCCERMGDHITNISEDIVYMATGRNFIDILEAQP